jgi:hypothetical protein
MENVNRTFREEQSDGSFKEYDVEKFSQEGQRHFYLLGKVQQDLQETSDRYLILKEAESSLISKIKDQLNDDSIIKEQEDDSKDGKEQD